MSVENFCHEKLTLSKDRIFSESVRNVKNGTPGGLAFVGAGCGDPKMKYYYWNLLWARVCIIVCECWRGALSSENHPGIKATRLSGFLKYWEYF